MSDGPTGSHPAKNLPAGGPREGSSTEARLALIDLDVEALRSRISSDDPTPGGGSVSALAGALGAALGVMVWRLTQVKAADQWADGELAGLARSLEEVGGALAANVDRDAASYEAVIAALRLPKTSEEEKAVRRHAIEAATRVATEVPLETARLCARVMEMCLPAAHRGYPGAVTDAGVGLLMGFAGLNGALYNVEINLSGLPAGSYADAVGAEVAALRAVGQELLAKGDAEVRRRMAD